MFAIHIFSEGEFQSLLERVSYVAVQFYADWWQPCKTITSMYRNIAASHTVSGYLAFAEVNVDEVEQLASWYDITAMPTYLFFRDGIPVVINGDGSIKGPDVTRLRQAASTLFLLAKDRQLAEVTGRGRP